MLITFVFSFRNEEENIAELVRRTQEMVDGVEGLRYEMIFVNDASTDGSLNLLESLQKSHPITVINMSRCFGVTPCVLAGFSEAQGEAVVYMDSDLQDPPEIIPEMISKYKAGAEVVHTTRTHREGEGPIKLWLTRRAYRTINKFSDINLPENSGDFKLLSKKVVEEILNLKEYDPYMRGLSVWVGHKQDFVFYKREARWSGKTKFPLFSKNPIREFIRGLTAYSAAPLYISFLMGLIASLFSIGLNVYALTTKILGISTPGTPSVLIAIALFSGVLLMTNGILGIYIARIYYEIKGRPQYIIESISKPKKK
jgi:polyisoprenyl-phosphate glycosyltransferase